MTTLPEAGTTEWHRDRRRLLLGLTAVAAVAAGGGRAIGQGAGAVGLIAVDKAANKIRFYDPRSLREIRAIASPEATVHELALSHDRRRAYVPLYGDGIYGSNPAPNNKILVIDLAAMAITKVVDLDDYRAPHGLAARRDGLLWVVCERPSSLLLVDPVRGVVVAAHASSGEGPHFLALPAGEEKVYVSNKAADLGVFDVRAGRFVKPVALRGVSAGRGGEGLAVTADGKRIVVADNDRGELHVIHTATDAEIDRVPLRSMPPTNAERSRLVRLVYSPDGRHLVAAGYATGQVWIIAAADLRDQTVVAVAKGPQGIAFAPDGRSVIVSSHDNGLLSRIDLAAKAVIGSVDGGGGIEVLSFY